MSGSKGKSGAEKSDGDKNCYGFGEWEDISACIQVVNYCAKYLQVCVIIKGINQ